MPSAFGIACCRVCGEHDLGSKVAARLLAGKGLAVTALQRKMFKVMRRKVAGAPAAPGPRTMTATVSEGSIPSAVGSHPLVCALAATTLGAFLKHHDR